MTEQLQLNTHGEREVILCWQEEWYRMPFYLLDDVAAGWRDEGLIKAADDLDRWVKKNNCPENPDSSIIELKQILATEMPLMVAYKMEMYESSNR
jgi:hypothetical protein